MKNSKGNLVALFDLDGTLVETDAVNSAAYRRVLAREGIKNVDRLAGRISMRSILTSLGGISKADAHALSRAKSEEYVRLLWNSDLGPAAEALRMVLASREQFSKVVLLTDGQEQRALETLRYHGLDQCFDEIVCNAGDGDKYLNYFRSHDANPAVTIVWENDNKEIQSAITAGVKTDNIKKVG